MESWNGARPDLLTLSAAEILEKANGVERARACMRELVARTTSRHPDVSTVMHRIVSFHSVLLCT